MPGENDPSFRAEQASRLLANREFALAESNQHGDLSLSLGNSFMTRASNPEAPSPSYNAITATLSIPIRFSGHKAQTRYTKLKKESIANDEAPGAEVMQAQWSLLKKQRLQLQEELSIIQSLIADQESLVMFTSSTAVHHPLSCLEKLCEFKKIELSKKESLALINAQLYWHADRVNPNFSAQTNK
jgi:hypothetical protein